MSNNLKLKIRLLKHLYIINIIYKNKKYRPSYLFQNKNNYKW